MEIATPPTSKCIIYWKRKVKSEYMRLRQLKRFQANMGAKVSTGQQRLSLEGVSEMLRFSLWCWGSCRVAASPSELISCVFAASWVSWRRCCFSSRCYQPRAVSACRTQKSVGRVLAAARELLSPWSFRSLPAGTPSVLEGSEHFLWCSCPSWAGLAEVSWDQERSTRSCCLSGRFSAPFCTSAEFYRNSL